MEKITKINIQNEANINAEGIHTYHTAKSIICIDTGKVFTSVIDAAKDADCHYSHMINHLKGRTRHCKGKHYCYLSRATESLDAIVTRLRETSTMEDDARKWREYQAEQERLRKEEEARIAAERKAKEDYEKAVANAIAKIERRREISARAAQKYNESVARIMEAEMEYEALTGKAYGVNEDVA